LDDLAPGTWVVEVELFGFTKLHREIPITEQPATADWTLELRPRATTITRNQAPSAQRNRPANGFQTVAVNQNVENQVLAALAQVPGGASETPADTNESLLV